MNIMELMQQPEIGQALTSFMVKRGRAEQQNKVKNYKILNKTALKGQILFTGSSLMEQFPVVEIAQNHKLGKVVYNRGIGGYTTDDFLAEIDTVLFDLEPSKLFLNIGTNDFNEDVFGADWAERLLGNYEEIMTRIQNRLPDCQVYLMAYYPVNAVCADEMVRRSMLKTRTNAALDRINTEVAKLAASHGFQFINVNEGLTDEQGNLKEEYTLEGVHMYANAYEVVYRNLEAYL